MGEVRRMVMMKREKVRGLCGRLRLKIRVESQKRPVRKRFKKRANGW